MKRIATNSRVYAGTLTDNADLHERFREFAHAHDIRAGNVFLLGGLSEVTLGAFDFAKGERLEPLVFRGAFEIVGGHGLISTLDGEPHVHLHLSLSSRTEDNIRLIGGHVVNAKAFAVEFTLLSYEGEGLARTLHAGTGLQLLDVSS